MSTNKKERIWNDPPGIDPDPAQLDLIKDQNRKMEYLLQYPGDLADAQTIIKRWKMISIGMTYIFLAIAVAVMELLNIPLDILPFILPIVGLFFIVTGLVLYRKTGGQG